MKGRDRRDDGLRDLATLLARAYGRLAETSRTGAVSGPTAPQNRLDVSVSSRPHVDDHEAA